MPEPKRNRPPVARGAAPERSGRDTPKGSAPTPTERFAFRCEVLAEIALTTGKIAFDNLERVAAVPDLVRTEAAANGLPDVATVVLERADGRSVAIYRLPAEAGGGR